MIFIYAPERTGTTSVARLLAGYDRFTRHFAQDVYRRPCGEGYITEDNIARRTSKAVGSLDLVIFMVRDPIARVVSECFHKVNEGELEPCPKDIDNASWVMAVGDHDAMLDHVIYEVPCMGFDILSVPFQSPVMMYPTKPPMIACRLRDIDELPSALAALGFPMFGKEMTQENPCTYPDLKFPKCYVDRMMENIYTEYFYTDEEIDEMRVKWTDG